MEEDGYEVEDDDTLLLVKVAVVPMAGSMTGSRAAVRLAAAAASRTTYGRAHMS